MPAQSEPHFQTSRDRQGTMTEAIIDHQTACSRPRLARATVGLIGARGHTGAELLKLIAQHPNLSLAFASSRQLAGRPLPHRLRADDGSEAFFNLTAADLASHLADIYILALPNDASQEYMDAIDRARFDDDPFIIDLSADHRFDSTWVYGLPELNAESISQSRRIANPGCYATAMMLALTPVAHLMEGPPHCFGVSGYSGAGSTPSPRNDLDQLRDNLMPYALAGHVHEREVSRHLGCNVHFVPHVAQFFRGISMTVSTRLREPVSRDDLVVMHRSFYERQPFVHVTAGDVPLVRDAVDTCGCVIGGFAVSERDSRDVRLVSTLDNLLKGAASQAIQNINLACGWEMTEGLTP